MSESLTNSQPESGLTAKFLKTLPVLQFFGTIIVSVAVSAIGVYSTISLNQDSTAKEVEKLKGKQEQTDKQVSDWKAAGEKQIQDVKQEILTKKEFEAYWKQIDLMRDDIKAIRQIQEKSVEK